MSEGSSTQPTEAEAPELKVKNFGSVKDVAVCSDRNARYRRFMEDAHTIEDQIAGEKEQGFFAIFDGHGGKSAALFAQNNMHIFLAEELKKVAQIAPKDVATELESIKDAIKAAFSRTDSSMKDSVPSAGACVVVSLIRRFVDGKKYLISANAGDSRAILCRNGKALRLTEDHKATVTSEGERITAAGGFINNERVNGVVAISRSLGDHCMKDLIISDPYIYVTELTEEDTHLILACDGVWDVISDQDALELIKAESSAQSMAKKLLIQSLKGGSTDNISVLVAIL